MIMIGVHLFGQGLDIARGSIQRSMTRRWAFNSRNTWRRSENVRASTVCRRLLSVPGVGPVDALTLVERRLQQQHFRNDV